MLWVQLNWTCTVPHQGLAAAEASCQRHEPRVFAAAADDAAPKLRI
jgi:hypothetical protein